MCLIAINGAILGFDIAWDKAWFNFIWKYCKEGTYLAERQAKERNIVTTIGSVFVGIKPARYKGSVKIIRISK